MIYYIIFDYILLYFIIFDYILLYFIVFDYILLFFDQLILDLIEAYIPFFALFYENESMRPLCSQLINF